MANVVDLLGSTNMISKRNTSMSKPFMFYQLFNMISAILAPATICLLVAGSLSFILNISSSLALVLAVIPPAIYLGLCFKLKTDTQITIAAILSIIYAFLMLVVSMSIVGAMVKEKTILTPSSIFVIAMAFIYLVTAIMHPQEFNLIFYGFLYIVCIPSAYLLLTIYSMVNLNNVSWGTRETKPPPGAGQAAEPTTTKTTAQKAKGAFERFLSWIKCCKKAPQKTEQRPISQETPIVEPQEPEPGPQNTIVDGISEELDSRQDHVYDYPYQCWVSELQGMSTDMKLEEDSLELEEENFWIELQKKYLEPLPTDKAQQEKVKSGLKELRNKINFAFFILNALWLVATFTLQTFNVAIYIPIPLVNLSLQSQGTIQIDPIGFMFIIGFASSVFLQFIAMFFHRVNTLIHYIAFLETEPKPQSKTEDEYQLGKKIKSTPSSTASRSDYGSDSIQMSDIASTQSQDDSEYSEIEDSDDDDILYSTRQWRSRDGGTLV